MAITREQFEQGMTIAQYQAQMKQNQEAFAANLAKARVRPQDLAYFERFEQPLNVLVLTEDWCGDALANLPTLAGLAEQTGKLTLRIFLRDQHLDLADQYLKQGQYRSIPVFVFFDHDMRELGHFIERPAQATAEMQAATAALTAQHPELPDLPGSYDTMSDAAKALRIQSSRELRQRRASAWAEMLLDAIEQTLGEPATHA